MTFEVVVGDRVRTVSVVRKGALLHVDLDGTPHVVDARRIGESSLSLLVQAHGEAAPVRSVDAAFAARNGADGSELDVHLAGRTVPVQVRVAGSFGRQKKGAAGGHGAGPQRVTSPMPGKIVRVLVKPGDLVQARQGLVVVEAMKMENELRAARDGRVRELAVAEGQSVDAGAILVIVD